MPGKQLWLAALFVAALTALPSSALARDYAVIARNIIPSGEYGSVPPPANAAQQARMYNALTPLFNRGHGKDVELDFKSESLGNTAGRIEAVPRAGVKIIRDAYNVPHIYGQRRDDVTWGAGWVVAEDRGLLLKRPATSRCSQPWTRQA